MPRLPVVTAKKTLRRLRRAGFTVDTIVGSHHTLRSADGKSRVTARLHLGALV